MHTDHRPRLRSAAVVLGALVALTALAAGCSGSSNDRQASAWAKDHRLCLTFDSVTSWPNVEFTHDEADKWYSLPNTQTTNTTKYCEVQTDPLRARFTTTGGVPVTVSTLNNASTTSMTVTYDGTAVTMADADLVPGGNSYSIHLPNGETLWFGVGPDTDNKEFFLDVTSAK